jgi:small subunit ribosomal protein S18
MPRFYRQFDRRHFRSYPKECYFCKENKQVDYKDVNNLERYLNFFGAIQMRGRTGLCAKHQRQVAKAIKRAREIGLMSYTGR